MQIQGQIVGDTPGQTYGFEFVDFDITELLPPVPAAQVDAEVAAKDIDYGRLQSAIKRDRGWYR